MAKNKSYDEEFMNELFGEIQKDISNPLSDENFFNKYYDKK